MARGELYIKTSATSSITGNVNGWVDAYDTWGVSFTDASLSELITPAPMKAPVENKSRIQDGKRVVSSQTYVKKDERNVSLEMHVHAKSKAVFWQRYNSFCEQVLDRQFIDIKSGYVSGKVFHMTYESCSQFSEFMQEMAKFSLRLNEPNPADRTEAQQG